MKHYLIVIACSICISGFSQSNSQQPSNTELSVRQSLSADYLTENDYDYKTAEAKACHTILLNTFKISNTIAPLDISTVADPADKANLQSFIGGLNSILILTPSWNDLKIIVKNRVLADDKAHNRQPHLTN